MTYQEAYDKLQDIISTLQNEDISIDDMKEHIIKAKTLVGLCQKKLRDIEADLNEVLEDDVEDS
jgi:exodeoxyribonuclease VII small subunit